MADTSELVLYEQQDGVAVLTLNRPGQLNAWTPAMGAMYADRLDHAAADQAVRAIVVTGSGRGFCAGADMTLLREVGGGPAIVGTAERVFPTHALEIPKPIVAAINGACAGFGFVVALMCDIRLAAAGAKFTTAFARRGLVAEYGSAWMLPRVVGYGRALELLISGRVFVAEEAVQLGLVSRVSPPERLLEDATDHARELASLCSPWSMGAIKRQLQEDVGADLPVAINNADRWMEKSLRGPDFREGVASYLEQRTPHFEPVSSAPSARPDRPAHPI